MNNGISTIIYPVKDVAQAKPIYAALLGVAPYVDSAYYVGYRVGDQEVGLDPHGHKKGMTGPIGYRDVPDIQASLQQLVDAGAQVQEAPHDVGAGLLIATVKDADGNVLGLRQGS